MKKSPFSVVLLSATFTKDPFLKLLRITLAPASTPVKLPEMVPAFSGELFPKSAHPMFKMPVAMVRNKILSGVNFMRVNFFLQFLLQISWIEAIRQRVFQALLFYATSPL